MSKKTDWDALLAMSPNEKIEHDAQILIFQFLGRIDQAMKDQNISKKKLAQNVGTSASFITQLFRGDRKPNWSMLAKMSQVLNLEFKVMTDEMIQERLKEEIMDYHRKWAHTQQYLNLKNQK